MPEERSETVREARRRRTAANDPAPKDQLSRPPEPGGDERSPDPATALDLRTDPRVKGGTTGSSG